MVHVLFVWHSIRMVVHLHQLDVMQQAVLDALEHSVVKFVVAKLFSEAKRWARYLEFFCQIGQAQASRVMLAKAG